MDKRSISDLLGEPPKRQRGRPIVPERTRLVNAQAELAEIRAAKMRGELVEAAAVASAWADVLRDVRAALLAVPSRVAVRLDLTAAHVREIDAEIRAALTALGSEEPP